MTGKGTVVVIGSGAAGRAAARSLASFGWNVTIAENDRVGGTCLWHGCIPKKVLYMAASSARDARRAAQFGVACEEPRVDWQETLAWKWHAQETFAGDQKAALASRGITLIEGTAQFASDTEIEVGDRRIRFDHAVIATGAEPIMPTIPGIEFADSSAEALGYPELPESIAIIGAGFIALEFAGIFASLGSDVTVIARGDRILRALDDELADIARRRLSALGVKFLLQTATEAIVREGDGFGVRPTTQDGPETTVRCARVLSAVGRSPALGDLRIDAAGIVRNESGDLDLTAALQTSNPRVWACGDAVGRMMHTPVASMEGRLVAMSIETGTPIAPDYGVIPVACFTVPQLASVGLTQAEAEAEGIPMRVSRTLSPDLGAAVIDDERDTLTKLIIAEKDGRILGAQIAGPTASDSIFAAAIAVKAQMTAKQLRDVPGVHPSYAEGEFYAAW
ncbi:MAG: NAD(P)/FAD-dependent oxidoreductase [Coriobacteriia bacterium]|nr:NAD(P)/FAD-dependent oxidoreductase [Coriobacteriia bacterium]